MKAVILAGGFGTRLLEETEGRPKPMVEIGGRPILWHIMKIYAHHGVNEFVVCLGYKGYIIKEFFVNYRLHVSDITVNVASGSIDVHRNEADDWKVTLIETGLNTMTGGRVRRVRDYLDGEDFFLTYGDGVADIDIAALLSFHRAEGRLATVTAVTPPGRFGSLEMEGNRVTSFQEKPAGDHATINGGFFVLSPRVIEYIDGDDTVWERAPLERLARDGQLSAYRHDGFWHAMDTLRDKNQLEALWSGGNPPWKKW
jgi:glucose-1-phosphate cytidylyltransferase